MRWWYLAALAGEGGEEDGGGGRLGEFAALDDVLGREDVAEEGDDEARVVAVLLDRHVDGGEAELDGEVVGGGQQLVAVQQGDDFTRFRLLGQSGQRSSLDRVVRSCSRSPQIWSK